MRLLFLLFGLFCFTPFTHAQEPPSFHLVKDKQIKKTIQEQFKGFDLRIKQVRYKGSPLAIGRFRGGHQSLHLPEGFLLSTGSSQTIAQSNQEKGHTTAFSSQKSKQLQHISKEDLYDAAVLEIDFVPGKDYISFNYVFASEDYPEFIPNNYNDVLAIILTLPNGKQVDLAQHNGLRVRAQTINSENNPAFFVPNYHQKNASPQLPDSIQTKIKGRPCTLVKHPNIYSQNIESNLEYDGWTKVLQAKHKVAPKLPHRLQIVIADKGNPMYDSAIFLEMGSFHSHDKETFTTGVLRDDPNYYYRYDTLYDNVSQANIRDLPQKENMTCMTNYPDIEFDYDSPEILLKSIDWLDQIAQEFQLCPGHWIKIQGYAAAENNDAYNNELSKARSEAVRAYLIQKGISKKHIDIHWLGDNNALSKGELLKNKRVKIEFIPAPKKIKSSSNGKL